MFRPAGTVIVNTGTWATGVRDGNGVDEGAAEETGVLSCGNKEVLVAEGADGRVDVEPGTVACSKDVGVALKGNGVLVRGCKRYAPVMAIDVLVPLAFRTAASLAGPPEAAQNRIIRRMNRPVIPSACK